MRFNESARLDTSQVEDRRGSGGLRPGGTATVAGGGIGLLILIVGLFLGVDPGQLMNAVEQTQTGAQSGAAQQPIEGSQVAQACQTGADANARQDCRIVGVVNSVQAYWSQELPRQGGRYQPAQTKLFSGLTGTGCGTASSQVGPFYCPNDQSIYLDLGFFEELRSRFGASGGPFAEAYVLAHEYGHHLQNLAGVLDRVDHRDTGPQGSAVRSELMADCLAGVWAANAVETGFIERLTEQDIADGLSAAAAVGDDRIQKSMQGRVSPESWTHGSADQRQRWFKTGYQRGGIQSCDTFRGSV
jgi:uncharacterized protein